MSKSDFVKIVYEAVHTIMYQIAAWAKESVAQAVTIKWMNGVTHAQFKGKQLAVIK
ncbi:hypothetical protein I6N90_13360 [Paenibacillus sp. GSMTC-2017]|nr:hypothetical protein [Paenibacillus sp. GSMTC-2017]